MTNIHRSRIIPLVESIKKGETSVLQVVEETYQKIEQNKEYHTVLSLAKERAIARANELDLLIKSGAQVGKLAGVPFIAKDNILTFGTKTTAASKMLEDFESPYQATVIEKLEAEGAIMVAKSNLDSFAHGSSTENSFFGPTKNPRDSSRVPGGSSGGSAAAMALELVPFALGTDTGGSIRQPASFCGVFGLKPSYGSVSRYGVLAMASSTDVVGPITNNVFDAQLILEIISGKDSKDGTTVDINKPSSDVANPANLKVGLIKQYMGEGVSKDIKDAINIKVAELKNQGAEIVEVDLPSLELALPAYYIIVPAEISSNLARYDGIKYGYRSTNANTLDDVYKKTRAEGFNKENIRRILIGTYVLSSGYYEAYYKKAQTVRTLIIDELNKALAKVDFLVGPTTPTVAFELDRKTHDPLTMYSADIMTVGVSLAGLPAISVPVGKSGGLPIGMQVIGKHKDDFKVLDIADIITHKELGK